MSLPILVTISLFFFRIDYRKIVNLMTYSFVDCSTAVATEKPPYDCEGATYYQLAQRVSTSGKIFNILNISKYIKYFNEFLENCTPRAWKEFFQDPNVKDAIPHS